MAKPKSPTLFTIKALIPAELAYRLSNMEKWGTGLLILLVVLPFITSGLVRPLWWFIEPFRNIFIEFFAGSINDWSFMLNELIK